ncbi:Protein of unknown function [Cotesia congregata]|uniref:Uncharacterized protein n=1 Tax=Cotesia congregata TaxID=51543 RepID=A0A8J2MUS9_COTCN|nr:Protein of unknown function [Cotesia congregata]
MPRSSREYSDRGNYRVLPRTITYQEYGQAPMTIASGPIHSTDYYEDPFPDLYEDGHYGPGYQREQQMMGSTFAFGTERNPQYGPRAQNYYQPRTFQNYNQNRYHPGVIGPTRRTVRFEEDEDSEEAELRHKSDPSIICNCPFCPKGERQDVYDHLNGSGARQSEAMAKSIPPIDSSKLAETSHRTTIDDHGTDDSPETGTTANTERYDVTGTTKSATDDCRRVTSPTKDEPKCLTTGRGLSVYLRSPALRNEGVNALLDTVSDLNLLCIEELYDEALCNIENTGVVGGIATGSMPITDSISLKIFGVKITFHLVPEPPGGYRASLGNEFFVQNCVNISFYWNT